MMNCNNKIFVKMVGYKMMLIERKVDAITQKLQHMHMYNSSKEKAKI